MCESHEKPDCPGSLAKRFSRLITNTLHQWNHAMDKTTQSILAGFEWAARLDPAELFISAGVNEFSGTFASDNWSTLPDFVRAHAPATQAHIVLERAESAPEPAITFMGMSHHGDHWESIPGRFLQSSLGRPKSGAKKFRYAEMHEEYPDSPAKPCPPKDQQTENDENAEEADIEAEAGTARTSFQGTRIFFDPTPDHLPDMFKWVQTLPPENLQVVAIFDEMETGFSATNWDSLGHAPIEYGPVDRAALFLFRETPAAHSAESTHSTLMAFYYCRGSWKIIPPDVLPQLATLDPEKYSYCRPGHDVTFAHIKDEYPSCPLAADATITLSDIK